MMWLRELVSVILLFLPSICKGATILQETVMGIVGAENYTYYALVQPGTVYIFLRSHQGDADLYVSQGNGQPTYDVDNHDLQSTTCGLDYLLVPNTFHRPISIAVYGHPSHEVSIFEMKIIIDDSTEIEPVSSYNSDVDEEEPKPEATKATPSPQTEHINESESLLWTILLGMLKVLFDILVD